jgi:hypothetical protein
VSLRCGCFNEGDDIVFGPVHECSKNPAMTRPEPWWKPRPYEVVLGEDETHD